MKRIAVLLAIILISPQGSLGQESDAVRFYTVDTQHSLLDFTARHLGFGRVRGTFNSYNAAAAIHEKAFEESIFRVVVDVSSLDTQNPDRDGLLREQFFAAETYPRIVFESTGIHNRNDSWVMTGTLAIRDIVREVEIPFEIQSLAVRDQWENLRVVLEGSLTIDRNDYGVAYADNDFWDAIVSDEITIDISLGLESYNALNGIFPWRRSQISRYVRDRIDTMEWSELADSVRAIDADPNNPVQVGVNDLYRVSRAFMQQERYDDAARMIDLSLELIEASPGLPEETPIDFHLLAAENAHRSGLNPTRHLRAVAGIDATHPMLHAMQQSWQ